MAKSYRFNSLLCERIHSFLLKFDNEGLSDNETLVIEAIEKNETFTSLIGRYSSLKLEKHDLDNASFRLRNRVQRLLALPGQLTKKNFLDCVSVEKLDRVEKQLVGDGSHLIGREQEVQDVLNLVENKIYAVVFISAPAGAGKTVFWEEVEKRLAQKIEVHTLSAMSLTSFKLFQQWLCNNLFEDSTQEMLKLPEEELNQQIFQQAQKVNKVFVLDQTHLLEDKKYLLFIIHWAQIVRNAPFILLGNWELQEFTIAQKQRIPIFHYKLLPLKRTDILKICQANGYSDSQIHHLIDTYGGSPGVILETLERIKRFFGGSIELFLQQGTLLLSSEKKAEWEFALKSCTDLERKVLLEVSKKKGVTVVELRQYLSSHSTSEITDAIEKLEQKGILTTTGTEIITCEAVKKIINSLSS